MRDDEKSLIELVQNLQIHVLTAHQEGEGWLNISGKAL